jgi:hypothetical protein
MNYFAADRRSNTGAISIPINSIRRATMDEKEISIEGGGSANVVMRACRWHLTVFDTDKPPKNPKPGWKPPELKFEIYAVHK